MTSSILLAISGLVHRFWKKENNELSIMEKIAKPNSLFCHPFLLQNPWSEKADEKGIKMADFIIKNREVAVTIKTKRDLLQEAVNAEVHLLKLKESDTPLIEITYFTNWGNTTNSLVMLAKPKHVWQVKMIVKNAAMQNIRIRGGGAYHSFSHFQPDNGDLLLNTCDLWLAEEHNPNNKFRYKINKELMTMTLSPGVTNAEIICDMNKDGVCFSTNVDIPTATFGGILTGGCHGVGNDQPTMSEWITSMKVVNSKGNVQIIPSPNASEEEKKKVLNAVCVNLGTIGIIVEFTIKVFQMQNVEVVNQFNHSVDDIFGNATKLSHYLNKYWSLHVIWIPFNSLSLLEAVGQPFLPQLVKWDPREDDVYLRGINPTMRPVNTHRPFIYQLYDVIDFELNAGEGFLMSLIPDLTPALLSLGFKSFKKDTMKKNPKQKEVMKLPWAIFFQDGLDIARASDMDFCFPVYDLDNPTVVIDAIDDFKCLVKKHAEGGSFSDTPKYPFNMFFEVRFIAPSNSLLSPSNSSVNKSPKRIACLDIQSLSHAKGQQAFFKDLSEQWMKRGGVPHWQKEWAFDDDASRKRTIEYLQSRYGANFAEFLEVRKELGVDDHNIFMNDLLMELFGLKCDD